MVITITCLCRYPLIGGVNQHSINKKLLFLHSACTYKNFLQKYSVGPASEIFFFLLSECVTCCGVSSAKLWGEGAISNHNFRESKRGRVEEGEGGVAERILRIILLES